MEFDALFGFHFHSTPEEVVDYVECSHCGERVFDRRVDVQKSLKRVVDFFVAHLGMFHPEEIPPQSPV